MGRNDETMGEMFRGLRENRQRFRADLPICKVDGMTKLLPSINLPLADEWRCKYCHKTFPMTAEQAAKYPTIEDRRP